MTSATLKQIVDNYGIAFFTLYLVIPFYSRSAPNLPTLVTIAVTALVLYFTAALKVYQQFSDRRHFLIDSAVMLGGLITLYLLEIFLFSDGTGYQLMTYMFLSLSYLPTALRMERIKKTF